MKLITEDDDIVRPYYPTIEFRYRITIYGIFPLSRYDFYGWF